METSRIKRIGEESASAIRDSYMEQRDAAYTKAKRTRKYLFTDEIDQLIRAIYLRHPGAKTRPGIRMLAKKIGIPHWALKSEHASSDWRAPRNCLGASRSWRFSPDMPG
jgi:hypothetical protein